MYRLKNNFKKITTPKKNKQWDIVTSKTPCLVVHINNGFYGSFQLIALESVAFNCTFRSPLLKQLNVKQQV